MHSNHREYQQHGKPCGKLAAAMSIGALCAGLSATPAQAQTQTQTQSYLMTQLANLPEFNGSTRGNGIAIYGTLDESMNYTKVDKSVGKLQMQSGGEYSSKIGIYGAEDLGGGLRAEFNLESGFLADTGAEQDTTSMFNRASWVGLKSRDWGTVRMGNQLAASLPLFIDTFGVVATNSAFTWAGAAVVQTSKGVGYNSDLGTGATTLQTRVGKSISYTTPRLAGFDAQFLFAANATGAVTPRASNQGTVASYMNGPFYLAASYNQIWSTPVVVSTGTTAVAVRNDLIGLGAIYDIGTLVLSTSFSQLTPQLAADGIARVYTLGAILPSGRNTWRSSLVWRNASGVHDSSGATVRDSALGVMLGYDYALSKRTSLYTRLGMIKNYGASTVIFNSMSLPLQTGTANPQTGITTSTLAIGMYHHF